MRKKTSFAFLRGQIVAESPFSRMGEISNFSGEKRGRFVVKNGLFVQNYCFHEREFVVE
jgi:hypothetical protein